MDQPSSPLQPNDPADPAREEPDDAPARPPHDQPINVVPYRPATPCSDGGPPFTTGVAWVSADGRWPPLYLDSQTVQAGSYRPGCGREHGHSVPCDLVNCHGQTGDDSDPTYRQPLNALRHCWRRLAELEHEAGLLALRLIAYTVRRADPVIAYVCLDWTDQDGNYLTPTGDYRTADRGEYSDQEMSGRLDDAIYDFATTLTDANEVVWFPFTANFQALAQPDSQLDEDVWVDVARVLASTSQAVTTTPASAFDGGRRS